MTYRINYDQSGDGDSTCLYRLPVVAVLLACGVRSRTNFAGVVGEVGVHGITHAAR